MNTLVYFADPMCSWCWGFTASLDAVLEALPDAEVRYVMGGLAPDSDQFMDENMKDYVQHHWRAVAERSGASFNWEFWERCSPRRSTYPACRAVLACAAQDADRKEEVFRALQVAFYQNARDPSDQETLSLIAGELGFDRERFDHDVKSDVIEELFHEDMATCHAHGVAGFPALMLTRDRDRRWLSQGYAPPDAVLAGLEGL
jgi:putative protein-disulfide isomerase